MISLLLILRGSLLNYDVYFTVTYSDCFKKEAAAGVLIQIARDYHLFKVVLEFGDVKVVSK